MCQRMQSGYERILLDDLVLRIEIISLIHLNCLMLDPVVGFIIYGSDGVSAVTIGLRHLMVLMGMVCPSLLLVLILAVVVIVAFSTQ